MIIQQYLIAMSGLPGVGKTVLARMLSQHLSAVYLRIDSVEQALANSLLKIKEPQDAGYQAAYLLASDNIKLGCSVVVDAVNPIQATRDAWREIALQENVKLLEIEVICSDKSEHQKRVEGRKPDIKGHVLPGWQDVLDKEYAAWNDDCLVIDTAFTTPETCTRQILSTLSEN